MLNDGFMALGYGFPGLSSAPPNRAAGFALLTASVYLKPVWRPDRAQAASALRARLDFVVGAFAALAISSW